MRLMSLRLAAGALAASLALAACSTGGSDADPTSTGADGAAISVAISPATQLIPGRNIEAYDFNMAVWAPLTFVDADSTLTYVQAESIETEDAITWTITLREGWTFHDGTPVTAQAYVDSWNAVAYGPNAFENSGQLANVVGYADLNVTEGEPATEMSGLKVVDETTFTVTLLGPDSQFPMQVSQGQTAMYPMPTSALDDFEAYNRHPVGNGKFALTNDFVENEPLILEAYADYQGEAPTVSQITFVPYADTATAYTDVLAGNIDVAGLPPNKMAQSATDFGAERVYSFEAPGISFLGLPLQDPRYQDIRVRQAISMALDRETINKVVYGGLYTPATAFTPAIEPGTPVGICGELCEYQPEKAKALLTEAGGFTGSMNVYYPGGIGLDELYTAIANQLRQNLGVDAVATPSTDWAEFYETRLNGLATGPFFSRWGALYPSQQNTLRVFFVEGGGCANCIPWYDPEVADLIAAADAQVDGAEAASAYAVVQERILEEFPAPPLFFESYSFVTSERVAKLNTSAAGNPDYSQTILAEGA
ncbi:peptide ABC transporter substrate-binding protein [Cellulomonas timonensis]|uniref:peptide ABC transporter substrate-binding protein n=1 Tax=Cellulomonas timonensis TaxID=1689271 RepID=UPI000830025A|nr:ABC transporter substrate-binding protein [Cellulomonas timonensis]